jgi:hypothetical protein
VAFVCGAEWLKAGPGAFVYGPRDIAHGFRAIGERPVRMLVMCTPAGFERFVLDQAAPIAEPPTPPDMERLMALAERHGIEIHGPLPEPPADFCSVKDRRSAMQCPSGQSHPFTACETRSCCPSFLRTCDCQMPARFSIPGFARHPTTVESSL